MRRSRDCARTSRRAEVTRDKPKKRVGGVARRRKPKLAASASRVAAKPPAKMKSDDYDAQGQEFHGIRLTSPDKVLYPEQGITKLDLARYFHDVADWMLPHVGDRPLALVRCPEGREKECFFQKHPRPGTPKELRHVPIREKNKTETYVVVDDAAGLMSLAQIGALEVHAWGSRTDKLEQPDRLVFDLDPDPSVAWTDVIAAARQIRQFLEDLGLESFVKTTGGKGLHLVLPIERRHDWDAAKAFCKQVAEAIATGDPDRYTSNMSKRARVGKIYIDYLRNGRGATAIVPYSPRARAGAPVSTPLVWEELSPDLRSDRFTVENLRERLASLKRDPWEGIAKVRQTLTRPLARLGKLA